MENLIKKYAENTDWEWFENLWEANADYTEFRELYKHTKNKLNVPYDEKEFDMLWQYHVVLFPDLNHAKKEWLGILTGLY